ncbi:MAG: xanthine dehydrogenase family protein molybdopterin-binding subunit [Proteobacteria bacterium]|nr:xanthine dehydrogenase family protein molybdopterin-binding subunit [Pseudomonadota bacterium]
MAGDKQGKVNLGRRRFLQLGVLAGAGLTIGGYVVLGGEAVKTATEVWEAAPGSFAPNAWLRIGEDGAVTVRINHTEMGQGINTALAMIVAEELEADWTRVRAESAPAESVYKNPAYGAQLTAGSTSVTTSWDILRRAGAAAREMLIAAAAQTWNVAPDTCRAESGRVLHPPTDRSLDYGALASKAAGLPVPENPPLKDPGSYRIVGTPVHRLDGREKTEGRAVFGLDVRRPGLVRAAMVHAPVLGGKVVKVDDRDALRVKGVRRVVSLGASVAVVAETTWQALQGASALKVTWDRKESPAMDTETLKKRWPGLAAKEGRTVFEKGNVSQGAAGSGRTVRAAYFVPYQAHATPEPMNCTAHVHKDRCEVWAPTQNQDAAQEAAAKITGLPYEAVSIITPFVGGGFGRRVCVDYVVEAVTLSKILNQPVQVVWSREEDMRNDFYRPATYNEFEAVLDDQGRPQTWVHRIVGPDHMVSMLPKLLPGMMTYALPRGVRNLVSSVAGNLVPRFIAGKQAAEGAAPLPYDLEHVRVDFIQDDPGVPTGFWRSVAHSQNAFLVESFMNEIAAAGGRDPVDLRLELLEGNPSMRRVLELAVEKSGWGRPPAPGLHRGVAVHEFHHTLLACVAEVSVSPAGNVRVHRVVCALDCGVAVNPKNIAAQIRGGMAFGLTATIKGSITLDQGRVRQGNFDDFPILRMDEMPRVEVHILPSSRPPTGIGEAAVPLIAPAVCQAVFVATGVRVRDLPISSSLLAGRTGAS